MMTITATNIRRINFACLITCLASIVAAVFVGLLGIWDVIPTEHGILWRALGSCGTFFAGAVLGSLAIRCFRVNEEEQ
jgi:hypothetical protein